MWNSIVISILSLIVFTSFGSQAHGEVFLETGFERSSSLPTGWTQSQISGDATWAIQAGGRTGGSNPAAAHSGANNATLFAGNTNDNETRLISPIFDSEGFINITLSFWHTQTIWFSDQDELKVFYSSNGGANWTQLAHYTGDVPTWTERTINLPSTSATSRIAFEGNAKYGYGVCLDDIQVSGIPPSFSEVFVSATDAEASEAGQEPGTWTITRTGNTTGALSVNYSLGGTATAGSDYTVDAPSPITFAAGETSQVVTLTPVDDAVGEEDGVATLTLEPGTGYAIGRASADITIYSDDPFDLNILMIGSTRSYSEGNERGVVHEKPFDPTEIASHLRSIIAQDTAVSDTVNVEFEDIYKTKFQSVNYSGSQVYDFTSRCYSLAQHYFWPEGQAGRLANLRGEGETAWDTIVLSFDPYILANFPGMVAEGVKRIQNEVAQSTNPPQLVLLAQWPENSSSFSADDFNEVVTRVGHSADIPVVPAGQAWDSYSSQDSSASHPTPKGAYLAAAAIYSQLYGRSAKSSGYSDPAASDALADHAFSVVQANLGTFPYSEAYASINPFQMKSVTKRVVSYKHTGTSTERGIARALSRLDDVLRITLTSSGYAGDSGTRWDFNYGRGNDLWEDHKDYEVDPNKYDRSYGFPMHHYNMGNAPNTMPYGIDKHYENGVAYEDGTDLGIAYNMIRPDTRELSLPEDVRAIPIRLMWLKMREISPGLHPLGDSTHMSAHLDDASAAFMYTLLSGRCPVVEEPEAAGSTEWLQWLGHKVGYETAWQMAHLTTRAPGFRVLPSATNAKTVTPATTETMTVQFMNPPQQNVTVMVSVSNPAAAIVGPATLVFTPENYATPQNVTVRGIDGAAASEDFNVVFSTTSSDAVYDGLSDAWAYTINRSSPQSVSTADKGTTRITAFRDSPKSFNLDIAAANSGNTSFVGPNNGVLSWSGSDVVYTPNTAFTGKDGFAFAVLDSGMLSSGVIEIDVLDAAPVGTVAYNGNGSDSGSVPFDGNTYAENDTVRVLGNSGGLVKTGHSFAGWNTEFDGSGADYAADGTFTMGTEGVILFAQWVPDTYTISYAANHATAGTTPEDQTKTFGVDLVLADNSGGLTRTGFNFVGWNTAADGSGQSFAAGATLTLEQNTTLYARWNAPPAVSAGADQSATLSGSSAWSPAQADGVVAWYDAADMGTITLVDNKVSQWDDKSGHGNHATQTSAVNQPDFLASDPLMHHRPSIGNASADGSIGLITPTMSAKHVYVVSYYKDGVDATFDGYSTLMSGGGTNGEFRVMGNEDAGAFIETFNFNTAGTFVNGATSSSPLVLPLAASVLKFKSSAARSQAYRLGFNGLSDKRDWQGSYSEWLFTDGAEDAATQQKIEGYLAHKWGLADKLPVAHPHKAATPGGPTAVVRLNGTASDPEGAALNTIWTVLSGPGSVGFDDPAALDTLASFAVAGTYLLELTADDGSSQTTSQVTIDVSTQQLFDDWMAGFEVGAQTAPDDDPDGDGLPNAVENYFGTHPGDANAGLSAMQVRPGGASTTFEFSHPMAASPAPDLTAAYRWSKDLSVFHASGASFEGTAVTFSQSAPVNGMVIVTATITGTATDRIFVRLLVTQE